MNKTYRLKRKEYLYNILLGKLIDFLVNINLTGNKIEKDIHKLKDIANNYLYLILNVNPCRDTNTVP
jgi:hypothetical protein